MRLTQHEISTPLWSKLVEFYTPQLAAHRARLENPLLPEVERVALCYKIQSIKNFLALAEPEQKKVSGAGRTATP